MSTLRFRKFAKRGFCYSHCCVPVRFTAGQTSLLKASLANLQPIEGLTESLPSAPKKYVRSSKGLLPCGRVAGPTTGVMDAIERGKQRNVPSPRLQPLQFLALFLDPTFVLAFPAKKHTGNSEIAFVDGEICMKLVNICENNISRLVINGNPEPWEA